LLLFAGISSEKRGGFQWMSPCSIRSGDNDECPKADNWTDTHRLSGMPHSGQLSRYRWRSTKTAETHRANIMRKLEVHSVTELVRYVIDAELLSSAKKHIGLCGILLIPDRGGNPKMAEGRAG
jgi:hypothetical protein